ncbi:MAG: SPASM domain-containing protein [Vulcanimicrobiota bacterium]
MLLNINSNKAETGVAMTQEGFSLPWESVLFKNQALKTLRKDGTVVLLDPETGQWITADELDLEVLDLLVRPVKWRHVTEGKAPHEVRALSTRVGRLYRRKMLEIDGRSFVTPQNMISRRSIVLTHSQGSQESFSYSVPRWKTIISRILEGSSTRKFVIYLKGLQLLHRDEDLTALVTHIDGESRRRGREVVYAFESEEVVADTETLDFLVGCRAEVHWMAGRVSSQKLEGYLDALDTMENRGITVIPHIAWYGKECGDALELLLRRGRRILALDLPFTSGVCPAGKDGVKPDSLSCEVLEVLERLYLVAQECRSPFVLHDLSLRIAHMQSQGTLSHPCLASPCEAGKSVLSCDEEGRLYGCGSDMASRSGAMRMGSIDSVPDLEEYLQKNESLMRLKGRSVQSVPRCRRCTWKRFCCGGCVLRVTGSDGDLMREDPWCRFFQLFYESILWKMAVDPLFGVYLGGSRL